MRRGIIQIWIKLRRFVSRLAKPELFPFSELLLDLEANGRISKDSVDVMAFVWQLPFRAPFEEQASFSFVFEEGLCTIRIRDQRKSRSTNDTRSEVLAIWITEAEIDMEDSDQVTTIFERCLQAMNNIITAVAVIYDDYSMHPISKEHLGAVCYGYVYRRANDLEPDSFAFVIGAPKTYNTKTYLEHELDPILWLSGQLHAGVEHVLPALIAKHMAHVQFRNGHYQSSVVEASTSFESFLSSILYDMIIEEGGTEQDYLDKIEDGFAKRLRTEYHERLGGNWNPSNNGPIKDWRDDCYSARTLAVHRGIRLSDKQALNALKSTDAAWLFVMDRIKFNKTKYPGLAQKYLPPPGH